MKTDNIINAQESKLNNKAIDKIVENRVVLVGNPNVGKSCFFNHLSGMYVDVSNFPGTTVSIAKCKYKNYEIFDTPGVYGV